MEFDTSAAQLAYVLNSLVLLGLFSFATIPLFKPNKTWVGGYPSPQSCKKTFFVRYPYFQLKNVQNLYFLNFVTI